MIDQTIAMVGRGAKEEAALKLPLQVSLALGSVIWPVLATPGYMEWYTDITTAGRSQKVSHNLQPSIGDFYSTSNRGVSPRTIRHLHQMLHPPSAGQTLLVPRVLYIPYDITL